MFGASSPVGLLDCLSARRHTGWDTWLDETASQVSGVSSGTYTSHGMRNEIHSEKLVDRGVRSRPARWTRPDAPEIPTASSRGGDIARATGDAGAQEPSPVNRSPCDGSGPPGQ